MDYKNYFLYMEFNIRLYVLFVMNLIRLMMNYGVNFIFFSFEEVLKLKKICFGFFIYSYLKCLCDLII